ncbi:hypothetical protein BHE74_00045427, partial [Ensete ventricosum]
KSETTAPPCFLPVSSTGVPSRLLVAASLSLLFFLTCRSGSDRRPRRRSGGDSEEDEKGLKNLGNSYYLNTASATASPTPRPSPSPLGTRLSCLVDFVEHFRWRRQEDAHEFLRYVINSYQNACLKIHKRSISGDDPKAEERFMVQHRDEGDLWEGPAQPGEVPHGQGCPRTRSMRFLKDAVA